jgi:hypothetical protein
MTAIGNNPEPLPSPSHIRARTISILPVLPLGKQFFCGNYRFDQGK